MKRPIHLVTLVVLPALALALAAATPASSAPRAAAPLMRSAQPTSADPSLDETLANFRKYFRTYKETPVRVEALLSLEGVEDPAVVDTIAPILTDSDEQVVRAVVRVMSKFQERPPVDRMLAMLAEEKNEAIRIGILRALGEGKYTECGPAILACLADKNWDVRRRALQALGAQNDPALAVHIAPLCDDSEVAVRCEAIEALAKLGSELVVPKAIASLGHDRREVRTSALLALAQVRHKDAVEPLIERLAVEEGLLVPEITEVLANLTGQELAPEHAKWKAWWDQNKASFVLPTPEAVAYLRGHRDARTGGGGWNHVKSTVGFATIETASRSIMFVIDVSGSMESEVTEKERFSDGNYPSYQRIDIVKTELSNTLDRLERHVNFNILSFATKVKPWKDKLVPATVLNKSAAKDWVKRLQAIGGASKADIAQAGLTSFANLEMGKTATYDALMTALNVKPTGPKTGTYAETKDYAVDVDTIFFLSDGRPTVGVFVDPDDILREVNAANDLRKVVIHTIAIGEFQKDFMKRIAEQNRGVFVDLGK